MAPSKMTANPLKPARYRPGKGPQEESESESESASEPEQQTQPPPKATSYPKSSQPAFKSLAERRAQAAAAEAARLDAEKAALAAAEAEFETESSDSATSGSGSGSDSDASVASSDAESSSSEDAAPRRQLLRPTFIRKDQRAARVGQGDAAAAEQREADAAAEQAARRKEAATELVQEQLERQRAARAAGKKAWDESDDDGDGDGTGLAAVDDTDGVDPEAERAAWRLRELQRVRRARQAVEEAEKEREERERRRALSPGARAREDAEHLAKQKEEREGKGKVGYMQRYHHKGAFFLDDSKAKGLLDRDVMGSRFVDDVGGGGGGAGKEALPEYMQIRDMTKLGKKGRTKYRDLKTEDTGRWGAYEDRRPRDGFAGSNVDERFQPDRPDGRGRDGPTGANAMAVKERRKDSNGHVRDRKRSVSPIAHSDKRRRIA